MPRLKFSDTLAIDEVAPHRSTEALESLKSKIYSNEDSRVLCDQVAVGCHAGRNWIEGRNEINNWLSVLDEAI